MINLKELQSLLPSNAVVSAVFKNMPSDSLMNGNINWSSLYTFSAKQNIAVIVWDYIQQAVAEGKIATEQQPSKAQKIQWAMAVEQVEKKYER